MMGNNSKLDLVNDDVHTKFGLILSISSRDIPTVKTEYEHVTGFI